MFAHIRVACLLTFAVSFLKGVTLCDRLRLWTKSLKLYACLLGFVDKDRPKDQLRNAMICAFLSAVYDYETDWKPIIHANNSEFLRMLNRHVVDCPAKQKAFELFSTDLKGKLSKDGLERGSGAFRFYCAVINSEWLRGYSPQQLDEFGRLLQMVDDLLDYNQDKKRGEKNCFLVVEGASFVYDVRDFLQSKFFGELILRSPIVYSAILRRCERMIRQILQQEDTLAQKLRFCWKICRPNQVLLGGIAAWAAALLSNGPDWVNLPKVMAGLSMSLSVLGASIWHYGARADVYARKHWDLVIVRRPLLLVFIGELFFFASVLVSAVFLPWFCLAVALFNWTSIALYARVVDQYWPWKNLCIALGCTSPLLQGWFSGHRLNPIMPSLLLATFFFYLSREILKDIGDRVANHGKRFTMVMSLGVPASLRIAGVALLVCISLVLYSLRYADGLPLMWVTSVVGMAWLSWFAVNSLMAKDITSKFLWMDLGPASILVSMFVIKLSGG